MNVNEMMWQYFAEINKIPRPSGKEEKIRQYLIDFAKQNDLFYEIDEVGNLLIRKSATEGRETEDAVVLQSHLDMVCEKEPDVEIDFEKDAIQTEIVGDWMKAKGTTLGADDGIGLAMSMAILASKNVSHPALECLFTVDEEVGLLGASALKSNWLEGKVLLNLDTEEEGDFCVGCAGGLDTLFRVQYQREQLPDNYFCFEVSVGGLLGGHSGEDIHKGRGNAIKILAQYLQRVKEETDLRVLGIQGGNLRNAIPRDAKALVAVPSSYKETARVQLNVFIADMETQFREIEPSLKIDLSSKSKIEMCISPEVSDKLIDTLVDCPHGVLEMNQENPTLVQTSTNLAAITTNETIILIETSQRSSLEDRKFWACEQVIENFKLLNPKVEKGKDYPGWEPNFSSNILTKCKTKYLQMFGKEANVTVVHAGLECGIILKKYPKMDIISFGPTIQSPHSPIERLHIPSANRMMDFLVQVLN
jgi:dipeptidase D